MTEFAIPVAEFNALWALYNSTDGSNWRYNQSTVGTSVVPEYNVTDWYFPANLTAPCSEHWDGLTCQCPTHLDPGSQTITCAITEIQLQFHRLVGYLPSELADLSHLELLELSLNHLTGAYEATTIESILLDCFQVKSLPNLDT